VKLAYVDTSCFVAIAFGEPGATTAGRWIAGTDVVLASNLLEAELWATFTREGVGPSEALLDSISWVLPDRPLGPEIHRVLAAGRLRGADAWHLACALYVAGDPADLSFFTLDKRQRQVAKTLGFELR
jgi:predicted nucleic acid-binding protein